MKMYSKRRDHSIKMGYES